MTSTTLHNGRLGNQIIRNLAVSLIAEKYDLKVDYCNQEVFNALGIELFSGKNIFSETKILEDDNYFSVFHSGNVDYNLNPNNNYFQTREITNFLYAYLHTDRIKSKIMEKNNLKERYNNNNDLLIHIRLTDVQHHNPGATYYLNAIKKIVFDNLYITTDDPNHPIIRTILSTYPKALIIYDDEVKTIKFASTCKHIILSHGSFSAVIGYLSFFSNIYYPEYEMNKIWYGDMFSIKNWTKLSLR